MTANELPRTPRENEVALFATIDGQRVVAVIERDKAGFMYYIDTRCFDEDEDKFYWSEAMNTQSGIYGSVEEAIAGATEDVGQLVPIQAKS